MKVLPSCLLSSLLLAAAALLLVAPPVAAQPPNTTYYAALAFSTSTGKYGYTSGWLSDSNARRVALKNCKAEDARVLVVVGNGYAALALGDDRTVYGYGYGETASEAKQHALKNARARTTNCYTAVCVHSWAG
jgi:hypothetical protein